MTHEYTVDITAKAYDQALLFCNKRLAEKGMPAITVLPPGQVGDPGSCPCAKACGARVYTRDWFWQGQPSRYDDMPVDFVAEFDRKGPLGGINEPNPYVLPVRMPE